MSLLTKKTVILAKVEDTYGVDPTPVAGDNAVMAYEFESPDIEPNMIKRAYGNDDLSRYQELRGKTGFAFSVKTHLRGSGTEGTSPRRSPLYKAAGLKETIVSSASVSYAPRSSDFESAAMMAHLDGILYNLLGCVSDYELELVAGEPGVEIFSGKALYALPTDSAIVSPTFDSPDPPIMKGLTMTFGSYAAICEKITMKLGNAISERPDMNQTEGIKGFQITDRDPEGEITLEAVLRAESNADFLSYFHSGTTKALSIEIGSDAGNIATITAPKCYLRAPKLGDRDGARIFTLPIQIARDSGDDEISIALT